MADSVKKKSANIVVWIILLLLVIGLGGFGVSNFGRSSSPIATVGTVEISANQYYRGLQTELSSFQAQYGQALPLNQAIALGFDQRVRARLITTATLDNEAQNIGLSVGDEAVKNAVLAVPAFQGISGGFDRVAYKSALRRAGQTESEFENTIRNDAARTILQSAVVGGLTAPETMTETFLNYQQQRRNFSWIKLTADDLPEQIPAPTDADLDSYYNANSAEFTLPAKKRISYVWVTPIMILDSVTVPEEELKKTYDSRQDQYSQPARRQVERLVFATEADAKAAKAKLDSGEVSFEDLVKSRGLTLADIDLGDVSQDELKGAGEAIFAMQDTGIIGPLASDLGPALFRVSAFYDATQVTFDDAREEISAELSLDRARRKISASITEIDDLLAGGATLEDIANETDLELGTIDWFEGLSDGIAGYTDFRTAVAEVAEGDFPEVLQLDDGGIFALRLDKKIEPTLQPMDDVLSTVISGWERGEIEKRLGKLADATIARLGEGIAFNGLGYDVTPETEVLRNDTIEGLPNGLIAKVFETDKDSANIVPGDAARFIIYTDDIIAPDTSDPDYAALKSGLENQIKQALSGDVFAAFTKTLQTRDNIVVNQAVINAVHAQFPQ